MKKIPFIDFARGYAIFTIVCFHILQRMGLPPLLQKAIIFGGTGVHLFFLLSGFGLALGKPTSALVFFKKRASKVWLPYVLVLTISLAATLVFGIFNDGWAAWSAGVFLYQMFDERFIESFGGHFWFISTIVQFYIAFPFLLFLKNRLGAKRFFIACFLISVAWWLLVFALGMGEMRVWNSFFLQFLWEFALGISIAEFGLWIADFFNRSDTRQADEPNLTQPSLHLPASVFGKQSAIKNSEFRIPNSAILGLGLFFTAVMILMVVKMGAVGRIFNDVPALLGYSFLCLFLFQFSKKWLPPIERFFRWIGSFGYSLYLVHILGLETYLRVLQAFSIKIEWFWLLFYLPIALALGWLFEPVSQAWVRFVEKIGSKNAREGLRPE